MRYERILVPIDFSDDSVNALNTAMAEFARPGNTIVLLHVVDTASEEGNALSQGRKQAVSRGEISADSHPSTDPSELRLTQLQALAVPHAGKCKHIDVQVQTGQATDKIIETVTAKRIDLVRC